MVSFHYLALNSSTRTLRFLSSILSTIASLAFRRMAAKYAMPSSYVAAWNPFAPGTTQTSLASLPGSYVDVLVFGIRYDGQYLD
jgi:hypothetical protein